ncbi:MAG: FAD-dependent oxidoreductase, partial [Polyangia bacterium]
MGAGLAGLTVARKLAEQGVEVTVLEASARAGGKAGADLVDGRYREHGYHIFPAWYRNVREILGELGVELIDLDRWRYLKPGHSLAHMPSLRSPDSLASIVANLRAGVMPPNEMALYFYYVLDMLAEPLSNRALLDQVSRLGLLRSRWYATEPLAQLDAENILKASAIPAYELSAMTAKIVSANWMRAPRPLLSILPGDLQRTFINPYLERVEAAGARIELSTAVRSLEVRGRRIAAVHTATARRPADLFVIATPLEVTRRM